MSARGVHFAVSSTQARKLLAARSDRKLMSLIEQIEELGLQLVSVTQTNKVET